jgi:hypothetical protein
VGTAAKYRSILLTGLLLVCCLSLSAQVNASLDTNHYRIGEWMPLHLEATAPAGTDITWPLIGDEIEGLEVLDRTAVDSVQLDDVRQFNQTLTLIAFDSGYYPVPAFDFILNGDTVSTDALLLRIHSVPLDTSVTDIKPIKEPIHAPLTFKEILPWLLGGLGLIALIVIAYLLWQHRKRPVIEQKEPEIVVIPHEWALEQLQLLEKEQLWQRGEIKTYYIRLTDILRWYIELRFEQPAMESTTEEIMHRLKVLSLPNAVIEKTRSTLVLSDFVKFAKAKPLADEHEQAFKNVLEFIKITIPEKDTEATA